MISRSSFALALFASVTAFPAGASVVGPGDVVALGGTTTAARPEFGGVVINDNLIPFILDPTPLVPVNNVSGSVQNRVLNSATLGDLVFAPRIRDTQNIDTSEFQIVGFSLSGYAGFTTDVDFLTDGNGDVGPTSVARSADGDQLDFVYFDPILVEGVGPGPLQEESFFPAILTDAKYFTLTGTMTIFGVDPDNPGPVFSTTIRGLAVPSVVAPVPLPASGLLLLGGLAGISALRRRRGRTG